MIDFERARIIFELNKLALRIEKTLDLSLIR